MQCRYGKHGPGDDGGDGGHRLTERPFERYAARHRVDHAYDSFHKCCNHRVASKPCLRKSSGENKTMLAAILRHSMLCNQDWANQPTTAAKTTGTRQKQQEQQEQQEQQRQ